MLDYIHPYVTLNKCMYRTSFAFSHLTYYFNFEFTSHIVYKNWPSNFSNTVLPSGMSACIYDPLITKTTVFLNSCVCITIYFINASWDMVGDATSSHGIYFRCGLPSANVSLLIFSHLFSLIRFVACNASFFRWIVRVSWSISPMVFISFICLYYLNISATSRCPNISIPLSACIWLYLGIPNVCENVTSSALLWKYIWQFCSIYSPTLMNWVSYDLPPDFIWVLSISHEFSCPLHRTPVPSLRSLVSINLQSLVFTSP